MPTTECIAQLTLGFHPKLPVEVAFDAPQTSSDGGWLLLREVDDRIRLSSWFAQCLPDARAQDRTQHDRLEQVRQRLYQIALGYEDCNDADVLRSDPLLNVVCGRSVSDGAGLSSQPTLSRFENAIDPRSLRRLLGTFETAYVEALAPDTEVVVLDIDTTDDATHGAQQLTFFHGFYDHYMYHPMLVFDGQSGELISAILRPGNTHAARGALGVLRRLIRTIKSRFPNAQIVVRADSGFCVPRILKGLEQLDAELGGVDYVLGLAKNPVLLKMIGPALGRAEERFAETHRHVRDITAFWYAAATWSRERRVIAKAEYSEKGPNPRFVVSTLTEFSAELLYDAYCDRGQCENFIKDLKNALCADRLSCSSFVANSFRLMLHGAAYRLMLALRNEVKPIDAELGRRQFDTLRLALLKVSAIVMQSARRILVRLPTSFPLAQRFRAIAERLRAPPI